MENRVEDWMWQLGIYSIWRITFQILPRLLSNSLKKIENWGKNSIWELRGTSGIIHLSHDCSELTPFFSNSLIKWKMQVKMAYGNLAYCYHLRGEFAEFTPFF